MGGDARRTLILAAAGLVVLGVAVGAFSLGRSFAGTTAAVEEPAADLDAELGEVALEEEVPTSIPAHEEATTQPALTSVVVYISGAVALPDTYEVPADARVKDVVLAAGGLSADAAVDSVNLAERIADAQHIHIPRLGEELAPVAVSADAAGGSGGGLINLNSASVAELEELPRIGAALAERIVAWRGDNGPFQSVEDVQKVKGVSASVYDEIKNLISIE
jgi:competence protein ComEA